MTVKELIKHLEQCNPDYNVAVGYDDYSPDTVLERTNITNPEENTVAIY